MNWYDIGYLLNGNERQKAAYHALKKLRIFEELAEHSPVLVGTIPIAIDIESSDLDILLEAQDLQALGERLETLYHPREAHFGEQSSLAYYVAKLGAEGFEIEFFAQCRPTSQQNGYRHMLIEARLLALAGEKAHVAIRKMKAEGMKTEPAFAQYFGLAGNPYETLLKLEAWDDANLRKLLANDE
jgi:hypothetical protein